MPVVEVNSDEIWVGPWRVRRLFGEVLCNRRTHRNIPDPLEIVTGVVSGRRHFVCRVRRSL